MLLQEVIVCITKKDINISNIINMDCIYILYIKII